MPWSRIGSAPWLAASLSSLLAACGGMPEPIPVRDPAVTRALIASTLPPNIGDRAGWATDLHAAFGSIGLRIGPDSVCSVVAVIEQESSFRADPAVPNLGTIARQEIDRRADKAGVPRLVINAALALRSPDGRSYSERLEAARTERQLSELFDDFIGMVPMGKTFFANQNPVRTGGPMQVSVAFAQAYAQSHAYPYPVDGSIRREVFSRRGGIYFGVAHLLDYPARYDQPIYRFADFNAGHYSSRNAAFQKAVTMVTGVPLALDGDLALPGAEGERNPGATERAVRTLGKRLGLSNEAIRDDLLREKQSDFEKTRLYARVFELADQAQGRPVPRAALPQIALSSPKITRPLTTEWFARRVDERRRQCLLRSSAAM